METLSVLIVETDPANLNLIRECLEQKKDYRFEDKSAASLEAAEKMSAHYDFEVILANPVLPDANGLEVVRRLINAAPEAAIIVVADNPEDDGFALKSVHFGAQDYLEKERLSPFVLKKSILYSIERKNLLQEKEDLLNDFSTILNKLESLEKVIPICACCKKLRWDSKTWLDLEAYIARYADALEARLICPDCRQES